MRNDLVKYAIKHGEINRDKLCMMVSEMDQDMAERFTEAILDIVDIDEIKKNIPEVSNPYNLKGCRFFSYNYLNDQVSYEYDEEVTRYFETQKDADRFIVGKAPSYAGVGKPSDTYSIPATHIFTNISSCPLHRWLDDARENVDD